MKRYLVEVVKVDKNDGTILDSWDLFTYPTREEAVEEAKTVSDSSINARMLKYTNIIVNELEYDDESEALVRTRQVASFKIK